jgi:hypothetical protein
MKTPGGGRDETLAAAIGALGATRTRGLYLRRVALYPLSYERGSPDESGRCRRGDLNSHGRLPTTP